MSGLALLGQQTWLAFSLGKRTFAIGFFPETERILRGVFRSISPAQPHDDEINHLIERGTGLAGGFRDEQGMEKANHRCTGAHCGNADITRMEFAEATPDAITDAMPP